MKLPRPTALPATARITPIREPQESREVAVIHESLTRATSHHQPREPARLIGPAPRFRPVASASVRCSQRNDCRIAGLTPERGRCGATGVPLSAGPAWSPYDRPSQRTARLCAAVLDRRDTVPAPPVSTAVNTDTAPENGHQRTQAPENGQAHARERAENGQGHQRTQRTNAENERRERTQRTKRREPGRERTGRERARGRREEPENGTREQRTDRHKTGQRTENGQAQVRGREPKHLKKDIKKDRRSPNPKRTGVALTGVALTPKGQA